MEILQTILTIIQIITAIIVMILVLLQADNESGSIIAGSSDRISSMGMSKEARIARTTGYFGAAFILVTIASSVVMLINIK